MPRQRNYFHESLFKAFELNEKLRLSDNELLSAIRIMHPLVPVIGYGKSKTKLAQWRSQYNQGRLGQPKLMSFRYNQGLPCNQRLQPLSPEEFQMRLSTFRFKDDRYVSTQPKSRRIDPIGIA